MSRAAAWPRESHAAVTKRDQSHDLSSSLIDTESGSFEDVSSGGEGSYNDNGDDERIKRDSARLYGGN